MEYNRILVATDAKTIGEQHPFHATNPIRNVFLQCRMRGKVAVTSFCSQVLAETEWLSLRYATRTLTGLVDRNENPLLLPSVEMVRSPTILADQPIVKGAY